MLDTFKTEQTRLKIIEDNKDLFNALEKQSHWANQLYRQHKHRFNQ